MSTVCSRPQLSPSELRCSPHTTYYINFFVLRTAVALNGQLAKIEFSENNQIVLNCCYPSVNYLSLTLYSVLSEWEVVLNKYGVSHISNFWCEEVLFFQIGFFSGHSLRAFLHSQQKMEIDMASVLAGSASILVEEMSCEVRTELFLVAPDVEKKTAQITRVTDNNHSSCQVVWKESEVFEFGSTFRTYLTSPGQTKAGIEGMNLKLLVLELSDVVDWFHLGLYLGIPHSELMKTEAQYHGERRKTEMLNWWVNNGEQPMWSAVVRALEGIKMRGLAQKISVKYAAFMESHDQMSVSTATDQCSVHITGRQTVPVLLPASIQQVYSSLEERDEELTRISESLPAAKKEKIAAGRNCTQVQKQLIAAQASKKKLTVERDAARKKLEMKEGELRFLKQLQKKEKKNDELQAIIANKEGKISQLTKQLAEKEHELSQARKEIQELREQLQQTTVKLAEKSTQVCVMERVRADMERERSRADMMLMQLYAMKQGMQFPLERVNSVELDTLKQTVKEKEEEVGRLSSLLKTKETEKQKLVVQVEQQNQHKEDQLVQLAAKVCELRASLVEAEDRKMRAEVELEDLKSRNSVINKMMLAPQSCKAVGRGLQYGETNVIAQFQVHLSNANGEPCSERQEVSAELKSLVSGSVVQAEVSYQTSSAGSYEVSYRPRIRGRHELSVLVNGVSIKGSPFKVYVQQPPQLMGRPVKVIRGLFRPYRVTVSSSGQLIVAESGRTSVFDGQGELVHRFESVELQHSQIKMNPYGVAIDSSGTLYMCDWNSHKLSKMSLTGKVLKSVGGKGSGSTKFHCPDGIALKDNKLYICDTNNLRIQIFNSDLSFISSFSSHGSNEFCEPRDIALDQEDNIYVAQDDNLQVQVFSPSGTFLRSFGKYGSGSGELRGLYGIHVDHNIVYVTEIHNCLISAFTALGAFITSFGGRGSEEGEFNQPLGITMDCDGFLYVCDYDNHRIQIF